MDITHDNVCSSMLSYFYSHLLSTGRPISSFYLRAVGVLFSPVVSGRAAGKSLSGLYLRNGKV